jgi:uncharacterized protein YjiS (DUF1127 family)
MVQQSRQDATMSKIQGITEREPATAKRQVYSPLENYWNAFMEWRKRDRLGSQSCHLTDSELADTGIARGDIDDGSPYRDTDPGRIPSAN